MDKIDLPQKYILHQPWGGLGDQLAFSTLPELCYNNGIEFWLSSSNVYRNPEIYEIVWKTNPYVCGITDEPSNAGNQRYRGSEMQDGRYAKTIVETCESNHGFGFQNHLPIIYYQPELVKTFKDKTLIDFSIFSWKDKYNWDKIGEMLNSLENKENYLFIQSSKNSNAYFTIPGIDIFYFYNIYQYCDLINSAKEFWTLWSGGNTLSAAISRNKSVNNTTCFVPEGEDINFDAGIFLFNTIKYTKI